MINKIFILVEHSQVHLVLDRMKHIGYQLCGRGIYCCTHKQFIHVDEYNAVGYYGINGNHDENEGRSYYNSRGFIEVKLEDLWLPYNTFLAKVDSERGKVGVV